VGDEVGLLVAQAQFLAEVVAVEFHGGDGHAEQFRDLLGRPSLLDQGGHPDFLGGQVQVLRVQVLEERRDDVLQVRLQDPDVGQLDVGQLRLLELFQVGRQQLLHVVEHHVLDFPAVLLPLVQQHLHGGVDFLQVMGLSLQLPLPLAELLLRLLALDDFPLQGLGELQ